jgi:PLP dependent protein
MIAKPLLDVEIAANLAHVRERIAVAAQRVGRQPDDILLVAVSKTQPLAAIEAAWSAGQRDFGENRLEELWQKVAAARARGMDQIRWHMIGTIQGRKAAEAVGPLALIHSVDRFKIAERIGREAVVRGLVMDVLLEANVSGEASKHGFTPDEVMQTAPVLAALPGIRIQGLMTMAPLVDDPAAARPVFHRLRQLRDQVAERYVQIGWHHLSMGMTNDFEVAIEEGATIVRIGSAIFGTRT